MPRFRGWYGLTMLALESQRVIALRMAKLAGGGPEAKAEARRMVAEKIKAGVKAAGQAMAGSPPSAIVKGYRKRVRANAKRLSK